jgi:hypothetical protein
MTASHGTLVEAASAAFQALARPSPVKISIANNYGVTEPDRLSASPSSWRLTAELGMRAMALMIATPSFEEA